VGTPPGLYRIQINPRLGVTTLLFGVTGQIEALGLELLELRRIRARPTLNQAITARFMACEAKRTSRSPVGRRP
jgi:hypothetical protein